MWQGREFSPKKIKRQEIQTNGWFIFGSCDMIFEYGKLYEFTCIFPPRRRSGAQIWTTSLKNSRTATAFRSRQYGRKAGCSRRSRRRTRSGCPEESSKKACREAYDKFTDEQRAEYPDFEALRESFGQKYGPIAGEWELMADGPQKYKSFPSPEGVPEYLRIFWMCAMGDAMDRAQYRDIETRGHDPARRCIDRRICRDQAVFNKGFALVFPPLYAGRRLPLPLCFRTQ